MQNEAIHKQYIDIARYLYLGRSKGQRKIKYNVECIVNVPYFSILSPHFTTPTLVEDTADEPGPVVKQSSGTSSLVAGRQPRTPLNALFYVKLPLCLVNRNWSP